MGRFQSPLTQLMNPNALKDLSKIDEQLDEELKKDEIDRDKVLKLKLRKRYRAMEIGSLYTRDYRALYPW